MNRIEKLVQNVTRRMIASVALFALFVPAAAVWGVQARTMENGPLATLIVLWVAAIAVLPRTTSPGRWPVPETPEQEDRLDMLREHLRTLQTRATYIRGVYFVTALLLMVLLPTLGL